MWSLLLVGLVAGAFSGLLGIGGGIILVPGLIFALRATIHEAICISLAVIVPTALVGFLKHYHGAGVDFRAVMITVVGGVIGSLIGATLATSVPAATLKKIFAIFLIVLGLNMLFGWSSKIVQRYARGPVVDAPIQEDV